MTWQSWAMVCLAVAIGALIWTYGEILGTVVLFMCFACFCFGRVDAQQEEAALERLRRKMK